MTSTAAARPSAAGTSWPVPDPRMLRRCLGRFVTGVTVVTYRDREQIRGATVNSFTSVSLDPPLVLVSFAKTSRACAALVDKPFAVNVLRADQMDVAMRFAGAPHDTRINWDPHPDPATPPSLAEAVAVIRCAPWQRHDAGDHVLHLGRVIGAEQRLGDPLAFGDGRFLSTGPVPTPRGDQ